MMGVGNKEELYWKLLGPLVWIYLLLLTKYVLGTYEVIIVNKIIAF